MRRPSSARSRSVSALKAAKAETRAGLTHGRRDAAKGVIGASKMADRSPNGRNGRTPSDGAPVASHRARITPQGPRFAKAPLAVSSNFRRTVDLIQGFDKRQK